MKRPTPKRPDNRKSNRPSSRPQPRSESTPAASSRPHNRPSGFSQAGRRTSNRDSSNGPSRVHRPIQMAIVESLHLIFDDGLYADKVIERQFKAHREWGSRDRKQIAETIYEIVRWKRLISFCLGGQLENDHKSLWRALGVYKVLSHQGNEASLEAILRSLPEWSEINPREIIHRRKQAEKFPAVKQSVPDWMYELGKSELGDKWDSYLAHLNEQAPVFLRANRLKTDREALRIKLLADEVETEVVPELPDALRLKERKNVFPTEAFKSGLFEMQDGASQQVAPMLAPEPGMRIIDACAGAGGKSLHIASFMKNKGKILALDIHQYKLDELRKRASRNGIDIIEVKLIESNKTIKRLENTADRLLLDVPCSGLGVLRRNPDAKWKLSLERIDELRALQTEIINTYSAMTKPGGIMVYATCSVLPSENEQQVEKFLKANKDSWELITEKKFAPGKHGFDGFYSASLKRLN